MKVLFFGSLLVVLGIVGLAAIEWTIQSITAPRTTPPQPVFRFVTKQEAKPVVWHTSTGPNDCTVLKDRLQRDEQARLADLIGSADSTGASRAVENPCTVFQLGEVDPGAEVEVLGECGELARVRILAGALRDRIGCIAPDRLTDSPG